MPNRIIKESAFTSDKIAQLSDFEFRLWVGLITQADDAGRGDARPAIIKGRVFALRECVTLKDIDDALHRLSAHSCVTLYMVGGKPYYTFPKWATHQRVRDAKPRYPGIDDADDCAASCGESRRVAANRGEVPPSRARAESNPIQSESKSESESESNTTRESAFDAFWSAYPKKKNKEDARKAFAKVKAPLETLVSAIENQKKSKDWQKDKGQYIPYPATWLRAGAWENEEYDAPTQKQYTTKGSFFDE